MLPYLIDSLQEKYVSCHSLMMMKAVTIEKLMEYNRQGLIPGPAETEEAFYARAEYCLNLDGTVITEVPKYDLAPSWVPIYFSNQNLAPWHGGCAWIYQMEENSPTAAFLQIRKRLWGLYKPQELISHELCHIGRMMFDEPDFEELLAYRTTTGWRRWLGPIVKSSFESMLFVLALVLVLFADLFALFVDPTAWVFASWLELLPISLIMLALGRLWLRHWQYNRCIKKLQSIFGDKAEAVAYRLTDSEIKSCNFSGDDSFRWQFLIKIYS